MTFYYCDEAEWDRRCEEQAERIENNPEFKAQFEVWAEHSRRCEAERIAWEEVNA